MEQHDDEHHDDGHQHHMAQLRRQLNPPPSYWVPHPDLVWAPCVKKSDGVYVDEAGKEVTYADRVEEVKDQAQLESVEDICDVDVVSEGVLLHVVRTRYQRDLIYTFISRILIAVNPFKKINVISADWLQRYLKPSAADRKTPHIYGIGADAMRGVMGSGRRSQAVLVSGESGAGKTESAKLVLSFIAAYSSASCGHGVGASSFYEPPDAGSGAGSPTARGLQRPSAVDRSFSRYKSRSLEDGHNNIQDQIMQTNPILEAFGNAMTERNNNSSRFGKWLEISFAEGGGIAGCQIIDYVLELTRVTGATAKERSYHIFFALAQMRDHDALKDLGVMPADQYAYFKGCKHSAGTVDDGQVFDEVLDAFESLDFEAELQKEIFQVTIGILTLGNVQFTEASDSLAFADDGPAQKAADLLGVDLASLRKALLVRESTVQGQVIQKMLSASQAAAERDALARLIYGRLFRWLIARINRKLLRGVQVSQFLGLLDIAGFESFKTNSLEQLLINLSNEHLQAHFNHSFFSMELDIYRSEGVEVSFDDINFHDNKDIIELISGKGGILSSLDDMANMPKAPDSDMKWAEHICKVNAKSDRFEKPKFQGCFIVKHFAGPVQYQAQGFLEKNLNKPPREGPNCLLTSSNSVLKELGGAITAELDAIEQAGSAKSGTKRKVQTVSNEFKDSINSLVAKLKEADPHFIRCIKPNQEKVPNSFVAKLAMEQLLYSGVLEAVRIRQTGYAMRTPFEEFVAEYAELAPREKRGSLAGLQRIEDARERTQALLEALPESLAFEGREARLRPEGSEVQLGKTKLFARATFTARLEEGLQICRAIEDAKLRQATQALEDAIRSRAVPQLREALGLCRECGVEEAALQEANQILEEEIHKEEVRERLQEGIDARDVRAVKRAIADGERLRLTEPDLAKARDFVMKEQMEWAHREMEKAMEARQIEQLRTAIGEAEEAGVQRRDPAIKAARQTLAALEAELQATEALRGAAESRDVAQLEAAIQAGEEILAAGSEVLETARRVLQEEKAKAAALERLAVAARAREVRELEEALRGAEAAGVEDREALEGARAALEEEKAKAAARQRLEEATSARDVAALEEALRGAEEVGVEEAEEVLQCAQTVLREEKAKAAARERLVAAIAARLVGELEEALRDARELGIESSESVGLLENASQVLKEETAKAAARDALAAAAAARDIAALELALGGAQEVGLEEGEMAEANKVLAQEVAKRDARAALNAAQADLDVPRLREAIRAGAVAGLSDEELAGARGTLAREERRAEALSALQSALAGRGLEALRAAVGAAEECGIEGALLEECRAAVLVEERKAAAREQLRAAAGSRERGALREALAEGAAAGLAAGELAEGERILGEEERKAAAVARASAAATAAEAGGVGEARQAQVDELRAAVAQCEAASVDDPSLQAFRSTLAAEVRKDAALATMQQAVRGCCSKELQAAIAESSQAGVRAEELAAAKVRLAELKRQEAAREALQVASEGTDAEALGLAISEAQATGIEEEVVSRADVLLQLLLATDAGVVEGLGSAIRVAEERGIDSPQLLRAKQTLQDLQRQHAARGGLEAAMLAGDVEQLRAAVREGHQAGLRHGELQAAREALAQEECKAAAKKSLEQALAKRGLADLYSAVVECKRCGIDAGPQFEEAENAFGALTEGIAERVDLRAMRAWLLPPPRALLFELALLSAQGIGLGGMDWKASGPPPVAGAAVGAHFAAMLEGVWQAKDGNVLQELCANLRLCQLREGQPAEGAESLPLADAAGSLGLRLLFQIGWELRAKHCADLEADDPLADLMRHPLSLVCMVLYTQQSADVDRMLLFPDVPALQPQDPAINSFSPRGSAAVCRERLRAYRCYREQLAARRAPRNPAIAVEAIGAAAGCVDALRALEAQGRLGAKPAGQLLDEEAPAAKGRLEAWAKSACLLSALACAYSGTGHEERTVFKVMVGAPLGLSEDLRRRRRGDTIFWAAPLSTTLDESVSRHYFTDEGSAGSAPDVVFVITGARQGLELFRVSQYPDEQELLLPACSLLRVQKVESPEGHRVFVHCEFVGTLLSEQLRSAALADLRETTYELAQRVAKERPGSTPGADGKAAKAACRPPALDWGHQEVARRALSPTIRSPHRSPASVAGRGARSTTTPQRSPASVAGRGARSTTTPQRRTPAAAPGPKGAVAGGGAGGGHSPGAVSEVVVQSLFSVFEAMDRRGAHRVSRDDYMWALKTFAGDPDVKKVSRTMGVSSHFFESSEDLTLLRFLYLALSSLPEAEKDRGMRFAVARMRQRRA